MAFLIAHRGFKTSNGENRMIDFQNALQVCKAVEFDIRLTKDNQIIIFHDDTFERIAHEKVNVNNLTYQDILNLDFFIKNITSIPPLLNDFSQKLSQEYQLINIEIKAELSHKYSQSELESIFLTIKKMQKNTNAEIIVSSFNQDILNEIKDRITLPIKKGYLFENKKDFHQTLAKDFDYIHPSIAVALEEEMINKLKTLHKPLNVWTFTTNEQAKKINNLYHNQVNGYISDNPDLNWNK